MVELLLSGDGVCALAEECRIPSHMASEHLSLMRQAGLLKAKRDGQRSFYNVVDPGLHLLSLRLREWFAPESGAR